MKAYKITLLIIDLDNVGKEEVVRILEDTKYPNYCISPETLDVKEADIGEWSDEHPLNRSGAEKTNYIEKVFI
jgi:hypothetical protein